MKRMLVVLMLLVLGYGAAVHFSPSIPSWGTAVAAHLKWQRSPDARPSSPRTWILRHSFSQSCRSKTMPAEVLKLVAEPVSEFQLPVDLEQRLRSAGALGINLDRATDDPRLVCCRCQAEVSGTTYLRRFECRDVSADLAGRRLLLELQTWNAARIRVGRAQD